MDIIVITLSIFVIFMCFYALYILGKMKYHIDSITLELGRMLEIIRKIKDK